MFVVVVAGLLSVKNSNESGTLRWKLTHGFQSCLQACQPGVSPGVSPGVARGATWRVTRRATWCRQACHLVLLFFLKENHSFKSSTCMCERVGMWFFDACSFLPSPPPLLQSGCEGQAIHTRTYLSREREQKEGRGGVRVCVCVYLFCWTEGIIPKREKKQQRKLMKMQ